MSAEPTLADLIEELTRLLIDLDKWEGETRPTSDQRIAEIQERVKVVKEAINAKRGEVKEPA